MQFHRATTLDQALQHLNEWGEGARVLAGGTDVMPRLLRREISPDALLHIGAVKDLSTVSHTDGTMIGPLVTHRTLATDANIAIANPALAMAARTVGGWQTQSVGTVGGNICNASPAADTAPPLLVADAVVTLSSRRGDRRLPLSDFFVARNETALDPDELLTSIDCEPLPERAAEVYIKLGRRGAMEVALVGIAVRLGFTPEGIVDSARIAVSSVAPTPRRVADAEAALIGSRLENGAFDAAGEALRMASSPIDDARASASYRLRTLQGLLERAAMQCREAAAG